MDEQDGSSKKVLLGASCSLLENQELLNNSTILDTLNTMLNDSTIGGRSNEKSNYGNSGEVPES